MSNVHFENSLIKLSLECMRLFPPFFQVHYSDSFQLLTNNFYALQNYERVWISVWFGISLWNQCGIRRNWSFLRCLRLCLLEACIGIWPTNSGSSIDFSEAKWKVGDFDFLQMQMCRIEQPILGQVQYTAHLFRLYNLR